MNDNFKCIYKILKTLEKAMDYPKIDIEEIGYERLQISKERWSKYMQMLLENGYIKGISVKTYTDGEKAIIDNGVEITLKGLEYLTENGIMQRIYKAALDISNFK